jgi:hypothetical protein
MGHYFVYANSQKVMGVNNGGVMLVARRDLIDPVYDDLSKSISTLSGFPTIKMLFYPSNYLNQIEAIKKYNSEFSHEKNIYNQLRPKLLSGYCNFNSTSLIKKPNREFIDSILEIFFSIGSKLTHEFIADGETLRIAEKPSGINTFFTGKKIGDTLGSCNVKKITNIEITEKQIMFYAGENNFMTVTRERCYH